MDNIISQGGIANWLRFEIREYWGLRDLWNDDEKEQFFTGKKIHNIIQFSSKELLQKVEYSFLHFEFNLTAPSKSNCNK